MGGLIPGVSTLYVLKCYNIVHLPRQCILKSMLKKVEGVLTAEKLSTKMAA